MKQKAKEKNHQAKRKKKCIHHFYCNQEFVVEKRIKEKKIETKFINILMNSCDIFIVLN